MINKEMEIYSLVGSIVDKIEKADLKDEERIKLVLMDLLISEYKKGAGNNDK